MSNMEALLDHVIINSESIVEYDGLKVPAAEVQITFRQVVMGPNGQATNEAGGKLIRGPVDGSYAFLLDGRTRDGRVIQFEYLFEAEAVARVTRQLGANSIVLPMTTMKTERRPT